MMMKSPTGAGRNLSLEGLGDYEYPFGDKIYVRYLLWAVGCGMWAVGCGLWDVGCGMWDVGCGLWPDTVLAECSMLKAADC